MIEGTGDTEGSPFALMLVTPLIGATGPTVYMLQNKS